MRLLPALLLLFALAGARAETPQRLLGLAAEGGDLRAELADGGVLRGADLAGAVLRFDALELRLDEVRRDEQVPGVAPGSFAGDVWLFRLLAREPGGEWAEFCTADANGERLALVLPTEPGGFAFTCSAGGNGRCIRLGYRPWARLADGRPLAPFHAACVHLLRAAYGGDERAFSRDAAPVDIYDRAGIQASANDPAHAFEAGWSEEGAVCLAHPRSPENGSLSEILRHAPRLIGRAGIEACDEARAAALGALVFNRSLR
ncbi:ADYC domain-containing protein [Falsiroseomonas sp.]|uniref:ADYC domain-containing protein n=1 Tax=Falsiroseomonas sp. TaxID=2870721 RepID=UPI0035667F37